MPKLSKEDVILKLMELGVEYDSAASYSELLKLLKESQEPKEESKTLEEPQEVEAEEKPKEEKPKANPFSSFEAKLPMTGKAHNMKKALMRQPKVPVMIPMGPEEKIGSTQQVTLNGYTMFIRKGVMVEVPLQVKEVIDEKLQHQMNVRQHPLLVGSGDPRDIKLQKFD